MIPKITLLQQPIEELEYPSRTYNIDIRFNPDNEYDDIDDRIVGYTDGLDAIQQAIYVILGTERYRHPIYSWDYGVELADLFGQPMPYVMSEIPRRINDALTQDNRIKDTQDFEFEVNRNKLHVTFTAITDAGNIPTTLEVAV